MEVDRIAELTVRYIHPLLVAVGGPHRRDYIPA